MKWKVCGLKDPDNIALVLEGVQPDYIGLIFYPHSPRFVGNLSPKCLPNFPEQTKKVGVFVNQSVEEIYRLAQEYGLDLLQLHGKESPKFCDTIRNKVRLPIIKAFSVGSEFDFSWLQEYEVDFFLFDAAGKNYGGNGISFDWQVLQYYYLSQPFFLSGGIGLEQVPLLSSLHFPSLHAIDVNSRFEISPGFKDPLLLKKFSHELEKIRTAPQNQR